MINSILWKIQYTFSLIFINKYITQKNNELLQKMSEYEGNFILVIGSNYKEKWFEYFCNLPENQDKMVISLDDDSSIKFTNKNLENIL